MEELLLEVLKKNDLLDPDSQTPVVIQSFSENSLRRLKFQKDCKLPLTYLFSNLSAEQGMSKKRIKQIREFATGIGPNKQVLLEDSGLVGRAQSEGLTVVPYTFRSNSVPDSFSNVRSEMSYFLYDLGVDALFTDNPDQFPRTPTQ